MTEYTTNNVRCTINGVPVLGPDRHLAPVCPHCGRQKRDCPYTIGLSCRVPCPDNGDIGRHARDREDYLTEECAAAEERAEKYLAEIKRMERRAQLDALRVQNEEMTTSLANARKAVDALVGARYNDSQKFDAQREALHREHTRVLAELDALKVRARGMRQALIEEAKWPTSAAQLRDAAGEPIP